MRELTLDSVVLDTPNVKRAAEFYADLLGWKIEFVNQDRTYARISCTSGGAKILFQRNDLYERPLWPEQKNAQQQQAHLDFAVSSEAEMREAAEHALACGAVKAQEQYGHNAESGKDDWITFLDPDGHPFCFVIWA